MSIERFPMGHLIIKKKIKYMFLTLIYLLPIVSNFQYIHIFDPPRADCRTCAVTPNA